jgi:hypothetical protein
MKKDSDSQSSPSSTNYLAVTLESPRTCTPLATADGDIICRSSTGVRQEDPLGSLFCSLAQQPVLRTLTKEFPNLSAILTYHDDIHITARRSLALKAWRLVVHSSLPTFLNPKCGTRHCPPIIKNGKAFMSLKTASKRSEGPLAKCCMNIVSHSCWS